MDNNSIKNTLQQKATTQPMSVEQLISQQAKAEVGSTFAKASKDIGNKFQDVSFSGRISDVYEKDRNGVYNARYENYLGAQGNENRLAEQQGWGEQLGNAIAKWGAKSFIYAADGVASYTYGVAQAIKDGDIKSLWNNDVSNFFDDQAKALDRKFSILYTDEEKAQGALGKTFTWSYALDSVANGMAFITGATLSEVPLAILTGGANLPTSFARMGAKMAGKTAVKNLDNLGVAVAKDATEKAVKTTAERVATEAGKKGLSALNRSIAIGKSGGEVLKTAGFLARSSMFEAGMEARQNFKENVDGFVDKYQQKYGEAPSFDVLKDYINDANSVANSVFAGNMAVLSVSNAVMFGKMFNLKPDVLGLSKGWNKLTGLGVETLGNGTKAITKANTFQKVLGTASPIIGKAFSEGVFEEGTQGIFGKAMTSYLDSKYLSNDGTLTYLEALAEGAKEQYTTSDGIHEMIMGSIIGLIGGNASAVVAKPLGALGVNSMKNSSFGIEGLFSDSYGTKRKRMGTEVDDYNKQLTTFRSATRLNSVASRTSENVDDFGLAEDTIENYNFMKMSSNFKDVSDTIEDYNTTIDLAEVDPQEMKALKLSPEGLVEYKQKLKDKFKQDYDSFQKAEKIVERLGIVDTGLNEGDQKEFKDGLVFSLMFADKAGANARQVAKNIQDLTGVDGAYDAMKFFDDTKGENLKLLQERNQKLKEKEDLTQTLVELGMSAPETEGRMKEVAHQREITTERLLKLETELKTLDEVLSNNVSTLSQDAFSKSAEVAPSFSTLINAYNKLDSYVESLQKTGKAEDARDLVFLKNQFKTLNAIDASSQNTVRRMFATNFFKKEGKGFVSSVIGSVYKPSEDFLKTIQDNSAIIEPILENFGLTEGTVQERVKAMMENNDELSNKEKFLIESLVRTIEMQRRVNEYAQEVREADVEDSIRNITPEGAPTRGDRLSKVRVNKEATTVVELNDIIKTITNEIDILTNKPTREALQEIKTKEKQLAEARQRLLDIQNGKIVTTTPAQSALSSIQSDNSDTVQVGDTIEWEIIKEDLKPFGEFSNQNEVDEFIEQRKKKYNLPVGDPLSSMSPQMENTLTRAEDGKPVDLNSLQELSNYLYQKYKEVFASKTDYKNRIDTSTTLQDTENQLNTLARMITHLSNVENAMKRQDNSKLPTLEDTLNEIAEEVINNEVEQILEDTPELIEEATEEELEEVIKEAKEEVTDKEFLSKVVETLKQDLEELEKSVTPDQELAEQIRQQIEKYEGAIIRENLGNNVSETPDNVQEGNTKFTQGETIQSVATDSNAVRAEEAQKELEEEIERLTNEIDELKTPFKFLDSESYKEYRALLDKKITPESGYDAVDDTRLEELEANIDKWLTIMGTNVDGVNLSDLIKQLVTLENAEVTETNNTEEIPVEEVEADASYIEGSLKNNFSIGVNTGLVTSKPFKRDGKLFTLVSNITLESLSEQAGFEIKEDDVEILPNTRSIVLSAEMVERINKGNNLNIFSTDVSVANTVYTPIIKRVVNMDGTEGFEVLHTDFDNPVDDQATAEVIEGQDLTFIVDTGDAYNQGLLEELRELQEERENPTLTNEELEVALQKAISKNTSIASHQSKIRTIKNKSFISTDDKAKLNKLEKELKTKVDALRMKVEDNLKDGKMKEKINISDELRESLHNNLKIEVVDNQNRTVQVLKGTRRDQSKQTESDKSELETLRAQIISDDNFLIQLVTNEGSRVPVQGMSVKAEKVYPGLINFNYNVTDGQVFKTNKQITTEEAKHIVDLGYVQNGKTYTRNGVEFDKSFIRTSVENKSGSRKPFIIVKRGSKKIALPVTVGREESKANLAMFQNVFNNQNMTTSDKAQKLNTLLAEAGIDIKETGNAFIALGDEISQEKYDNLFGKLQEKEYIRSVEDWTSQESSIQELILDSEARANFNLAEPFQSSKIKFDMSEYKPKSSSKKASDKKQEEVADSYVNVSSENIGLNRFKDQCK